MDYSPELHANLRCLFTTWFPDEIPKVDIYSIYDTGKNSFHGIDPENGKVGYLYLVDGICALLGEIERLKVKASWKNIPTAEELLEISSAPEIIEKKVSLIAQGARKAALRGARSYKHFFSPQSNLLKPVSERLKEFGYEVTCGRRDEEDYPYIKIEW